MIVLTFFLLLILAAVYLFFNHRKQGVTLLIFAVSILFWAGCGFLPNRMLKNLQSIEHASTQTQGWGKRNVIVVLGAGTVKPPNGPIQPSLFSYSRLLKAATVYKTCKKQKNTHCKIMISGGDTLKNGVAEATVYQNILLKLGEIDAADIYVESKSRNTWQNALFTAKILSEEEFDRLFLITSTMHAIRALLYFAYYKLYPQLLNADYIAAPIAWIPLGYNLALTDFAIHEYIGILRFHFYNLIGWNLPVENSCSIQSGKQ